MISGNRNLTPILILALVLPLAALAAGADDREAELDELRDRIRELSEDLQDDVSRRDQATVALRDAEREAGASRRRLRQIEGELAQAQQRLAELTSSQQETRARADAERSALAQEVALAYRTGSEEPIKLLLNQEDPAEFARILAYYGYFTRQRAARIEVVLATLEELRELEAAVTAEQARLAALAEEERGTLVAVEEARTRRAQAVATLEREIRDEGSRLERLRRDEQDLVALIAHLRSALADVPPDSVAAFEDLRGELAWPVPGRALNRYGQARAGGRMTWTGVRIGAEPGSEVRAVAHGRVAYADWLPGMGLLVVLDHGHGYMTLYGHNQALFAQPGDWVTAGAIIATVGDSGGQETAGLYYEIRKDGQPVDPAPWMTAGP